MDKETISLIKNLISTHSPKEQKEFILEYLLDNPIDNKIDQKDLLNFVNEKVLAKSNQGKNSITKRDYSKKKEKNYSHGFFVTDFKGGTCANCPQHIPAGNAFRQKIDGKYCNWHILCVPENQKPHLLNNKKYTKAMMPTTIDIDNTGENND